MKKNSNKDFIILIIAVPVILFIAYLSWANSKDNIAYSIQNRTINGFSIFYEAMNKLNVSAKTSNKKLGSEDVTSVQIIGACDNFNADNEEVKNWVNKGGTLVYAMNSSSLVNYAGEYSTNDDINEYKIGKGSIITVNADELTNNRLADNTDVSYKLFYKLAGLNKKVYFNEWYMYSKENEKNLWDYMSSDSKLFIYEFIIILMTFFWYKGKRFGKVETYYEETERSENEYLYSVSSVFRQAKCYDIILENYYKEFLKTLRLSDDKWIRYWEVNNLTEYKKAQEVYTFMHNNYKNRKSKEYLKIIKNIEFLSKYFIKRRETYWKVMK